MALAPHRSHFPTLFRSSVGRYRYAALAQTDDSSTPVLALSHRSGQDIVVKKDLTGLPGCPADSRLNFNFRQMMTSDQESAKVLQWNTSWGLLTSSERQLLRLSRQSIA
jgi:hypothetical protein